MEVRLYRCTVWTAHHGVFQRHGRRAVSDHLPSDKLESSEVMRRENRIRAKVIAQCMQALKNTRAVRCLSTRLAVPPIACGRQPEGDCEVGEKEHDEISQIVRGPEDQQPE